MFWKKESVKTQLDHAIEQLELDLQMTDGDSKEYGKKVKHLDQLYVIRTKNVAKGIDPNTVLICLANLAGILVIVGYEHGHVVASKAVGFAGKLR